MKDREDWMKKRIEDIPRPIVVGTFEVTEEQSAKAEADLKRLIEESTGKKVT